MSQLLLFGRDTKLQLSFLADRSNTFFNWKLLFNNLRHWLLLRSVNIKYSYLPPFLHIMVANWAVVYALSSAPPRAPWRASRRRRCSRARRTHWSTRGTTSTPSRAGSSWSTFPSTSRPAWSRWSSPPTCRATWNSFRARTGPPSQGSRKPCSTR